MTDKEKTMRAAFEALDARGRRLSERATVELRAEGKEVKLAGHAAVFNEKSEDLGGFKEIIAPGAFAGVLSDDVRFLVDHEGQPLARTRSGTLKLTEDDIGLAVRAELDGSDPDVQRLVPKIKRRDITQMSFAFRVLDDVVAWVGEELIRTITKLSSLYDVSVVTYPAYPQTDVAMRAILADRAGRRMSAGTGTANDAEAQKRFLEKMKERAEFVGRRLPAEDPLSLAAILKRARK